ncbi:AAA family ATPase [Nocardioides humi]|uniref:AAA family ATPase n=1 Tax=Nocardioides humi TaxID=449461 RepID=UPI001FEBA170|nr:AAA family ATPase [Nocardioides humi]
MDFDQPPVVRVSAEDRLDPDDWPMTIPAVAQVVREGLDLAAGVTFLVGENGSGKSTLVEAIAVAYGLSPEGGSAQGQHATRSSESPLHGALRLQRGIGAGRWGSSCARRRCTAGIPTWSRTRAARTRPRTAGSTR